MADPFGSGFTVKPTSVHPFGMVSVTVCSAVATCSVATFDGLPSSGRSTAHVVSLGPPGAMPPANVCAGCGAVPVTFWIRTVRFGN